SRPAAAERSAMVPRIRRLPLLYLLGLASLLSAALAWGQPPQKPGAHRMVIVPESDRFTPFAITIRAGETVQWVNMDTDDHTVVSDDAFNTAGHQGFN